MDTKKLNKMVVVFTLQTAGRYNGSSTYEYEVFVVFTLQTAGRYNSQSLEKAL